MKKQLVKLTAEQIKTLARVKAESESTQAVLGSVIESVWRESHEGNTNWITWPQTAEVRFYSESQSGRDCVTRCIAYFVNGRLQECIVSH